MLSAKDREGKVTVTPSPATEPPNGGRELRTDGFERYATVQEVTNLVR